MNTRIGNLFALALPVALLACAGPDDRAPSSPVAGSYRSGQLTLDLEPGGGVRLADAQGRVRMRGAHRVDGDVLVLDTYAPMQGAPDSCARHDGNARYRVLRAEGGLRLSPLADACPARTVAIGRRAWMRFH